MPATRTDEGHPGVWPGGEPDSVRDAYKRWLEEHPTPPPPPIVPARAYRPRRSR
ncbi:hypothetical protein AB0C10_37425 [Microbispora amethystogenes]|uniref:hypothetical protein n=1 Tax=Microbispora amethystogenes TaxID=1427754 RepID=UPI0033C5812E